MSWSFDVTAEAADFGKAAEAALEAATPRIEKYNPDGLDQAAAAVAATAKLVESGLLGSGVINCNLTGHGNPGHEPRSGYAGDTINIRLYAVRPPGIGG